MQNKQKQRIRDVYKRHHVHMVAFAILGICIGGLLMHGFLSTIPAEEITEPMAEETGVYTLPPASPKHLRIPKANIDVNFGPALGINDDQTIEVPDSYEEVGWYKYSPTPGELGPSVILGHVDSYQGPAIFFSLGELEKGDEVFIDRVDGSTATFTVTHLERHPQSGFPTEQVYGNIDHAGLRLVTCTGIYDHSTLRYSHNLIVYAELNSPATDIPN